MKAIGFAVLLLLLSLSVACNGGKKSQTVTETGEYVFLDGAAAAMIEVVQVTEGTSGSLMDSQIRLRNKRSGPVTVHVRARFYDSAGREVRSNFSQWNPLIFSGKSEKAYTAAAPDPTVTRVKFEIRSTSTEATLTPSKDR